MNGLKFRLSALDENDKIINYFDLTAEWSAELEMAMRSMNDASMENEAIDIIRQEMIKGIDRNMLKELIKRRI